MEARGSTQPFGVSFSRQITTLMSGDSGPDARFPSKVRQTVCSWSSELTCIETRTSRVQIQSPRLDCGCNNKLH
jgi:hypothetical protein